MITGPVQTQLAILVFFFLSTGAAITSLCISLVFCATSHCTCKLGYLKQGRVFSPPLLTECSVWKECLKQEKRQVFYISLTVHFIPDLNKQPSKHRCSGFALHSQALKSAIGLISMVVVLLTSHLVTRNRLTVLAISLWLLKSHHQELLSTTVNRGHRWTIGCWGYARFNPFSPSVPLKTT